jgi:ubiquinone biosynthesis protein Coq4
MIAIRRAFKALIKEAYLSEGPMGVLRFFGAMFLKTSVNKDKLWNYKRLGLLPEGTLGREYWKHLTEVGFGFPGEPGGIADSVAYHDIGHVLAEHDTTPLGEIQQGSFQGGNRREDGFFFIQFVILQFHHGFKITPVAPPQVGNFDPEKVLWAIHRGANCNVDITHQWNFWPLMSMPLQEARAQVALLPKLTARA